MASLETFESTLKEVVQAKRLSASKVGKLTEIAMKSMENDTQLVSILYRTHKSLPTAAKVSSLYAFDALARAARSQVNKHGLTGDINSEKGNCATFLLKIEGVLDGLFQDMIMAGSPETKEKSKKILDIWAKANTFPPAVLTGLTNVVKEAEKERNDVKPITADPRTSTQSSEANPTSASGPPFSNIPSVDPVQSTLLALLTQAAAASPPSNGQTAPNTVLAPQLNTSQLALLQQLTQTAKLSNGVPQQQPILPVPSALTNSTFPEVAGQPTAYGDDRYGSGGRAARHERNISPFQSRDDFYDDRQASRGGNRGGFRGRGRDDGRGRWDRRERERERDLSPPYRTRQSRSRSPPSRYGGRRDTKPYSPPRRPSIMPLAAKGPSNSAEVIPDAPEVEKDEFGRDIRPSSPKEKPSADDQLAQPPLAPEEPKNDQMPLSPSEVANTSSQVPDTLTPSTSSLPIHNFDMTADFSSPSSWEALNKMWEATYGYSPSSEALVQFVFSGGMVNPTTLATQTSQEQGWSDQSWMGSNAERGRGQAWRGSKGRGNFQTGGRGRGYRFEDSQEISEQWVQDQTSSSVGPSADFGIPASGGQGMSPPMDSGVQTAPQGSTTGRTGGAGGRMQRVGDRWVFVRDTPQEGS